MEVAAKTVVSMHYKVSDPSGRQIDASAPDAPMSYLHGAHNVIPGIERALLGKKAGDHVEATVSPAEGYGERNPDLVQRVPAKRLKGAGKLQPGMQLRVNTQQGQRQVTVLKVGRFTVDVDGNHPLAGLELRFEIDVVDVREATEEELQHGHAHGPGGHQHS